MATILIVEDDILLADCFVRWLAAAGYKTQHAPDAQAAIDVIDATIPEVILLDMLLPGANGVQLLHTLRSHADLAGIPIILCSSALPADVPDMNAYGVVNVLDKTTLTRQRLQEAVNAAAI